MAMTRLTAACSLALALLLVGVPAGAYQPPAQGDVILKDFHFSDGETLPELRIHYRTFGQPRHDEHGVVTNAVLILHGTTGSGAQFVRPSFAGELFEAGQPLDAAHFYIILPDGIGHGDSSKPSDGLHARFPHYGYRDMIEAQYRLLTEGLGVDHLRLVMGTSMGGMHTWLWGELHPDFMDALMPLACLPEQISGRNRVWRRVVIDAIRGDPAWTNGEYTTEPPSLRTAAEMLFLVSSNPVIRQREMPTLAASDRVLDAYVTRMEKLLDANDVLYAVAASEDYDPGPALEKIQAPLLAINSADDLINPPELGVLEREIHRVPRGRAVVIPRSEETRGHGTHTLAAVWKPYLIDLLAESGSQE
jgi:homoserine O-acetyltransferase/O-succinyltransferase